MSDYKISSKLNQKTIDGKFLEIVKKYPYDKRLNIKTLIEIIPYKRTEFSFRNFKVFNWIFPKPTNSNDSAGQDGDRSYDNKFFYYKDGSVWKRSPFAIFKPQRIRNSIEINFHYENLPFVTNPRASLVPRRITDFGKLNEETYDTYYFYAKTDVGWRRYPLNTFSPSKMTIF